MKRLLFPRRFTLGSICIGITAVWMSLDFILSSFLGKSHIFPPSIPVIIAIGWLGVILLASGFMVGNRKAKRFSLLVDLNLDINRAILLEEDVVRIYDTVLDYVFRIFPQAKFGSVLTLGEDGYLTFAAAKGYQGDYTRNFRLKLEDSFIFQESGGNVTGARLISDKTLFRLHVRFHPENWDFRSIISAPLFVNGSLFGLLNLDSDIPNIFKATDLQIVEQLAAQIEVCLYARGMYLERIEESREDALTGVPTRRYFEELLARELERADRYPARFVLALFDVDGLKQVNDSLGHRAGDRLLAVVAENLRKGTRSTDILGRFGGDEFVGLYHGGDAESLGRHLAADMAKLRDMPIHFEGATFNASYCFGLAQYPDEGKDLEALTDVADRRLYEMKKTMKGRA